MNIANKKITIEDVNHRTFMKKGQLEYFQKIVSDSDKAKRLEKQECQCCFYDSRIGGAAMTDSTCGLCEKTTHFGSTAVDKLCKECAKKHDLCKHCGADINYNKREEL